MVAHLGEDQPFYALLTESLEGTVSHITVADMAAHYIKEIQTVQPEGPYFLGGFCGQGVVVFEMAQQLVARGVRCVEVPFVGQQLNRMASTLLQVFREARIDLYRDADLLDDLSRLSIVEKSFGYKLEAPHDRKKGHADRAFALAIALPATLDCVTWLIRRFSPKTGSMPANNPPSRCGPPCWSIGPGECDQSPFVLVNKMFPNMGNVRGPPRLP